MRAAKRNDRRAVRLWSSGQPDDMSLRRASGPSEVPETVNPSIGGNKDGILTAHVIKGIAQMTTEKVNTQELASLPQLEPATLRLLAWLTADPGPTRRKAAISQLWPSGLWLVELSTAVNPYCPGRSASFAGAIELAIAALDESREDSRAGSEQGDKRLQLGN